MIRRIELRNFMSHAHTVIEPAAGLTVLVGPNNCGKSAVVEALRILSTNDRSNYITRHGEREAVIAVETDDGRTIEWRRRRDSVSYIIDGEKFDRLRGGIPEKLHEVLRLPQVETDSETDNTFDIHFGEQKYPIFLLDRPESHAAQFFASSSDAHKLMEMQALHRQKVYDHKQDGKRLEGRAKKQEDQLAQLEPVPELDERLKQIEGKYSQLRELTQQLKGLEASEGELRRLHDEVRQLDAERRAMVPLTPPPALDDPRPLTSLIQRMQDTASAAQMASDELLSLTGLVSPPAMADTQSLAEHITRLEHLDQTRAQLKCEATILLPLHEPPQAADVVGLASMIDQIETIASDLRLWNEQRATLARCAPPPEPADEVSLARDLAALEQAHRNVADGEQVHVLLAALPQAPALTDTAPLVELIDAVTQAHDEVKIGREAVTNASDALAETEQEIRRLASEQETCPTCGAELDPDRLVEQAATGIGGHAHA